VPHEPRDTDEVSPLELFFDLVFVFAVSQAFGSPSQVPDLARREHAAQAGPLGRAQPLPDLPQTAARISHVVTFLRGGVRKRVISRKRA
jgi:uncharacterized protein (DUF169 family)